jgi:hypothetical protein
MPTLSACPAKLEDHSQPMDEFAGNVRKSFASLGAQTAEIGFF